MNEFEKEDADAVAFDIGGQCLVPHDRKVTGRRKYRLYLLACLFTGVESDREILERIEGLALRLRTKHNERSE